MAEVKWIKITVDMFDNRKIKHLRKLPEGDSIVLIWVMLLTMAGRCNANGLIFLTENIPYTPKMLADELDFEESTVRLALDALEHFGMICTSDDGFLSISGWEKHQNVDRLAEIREYNRLAKQKSREKQKLLQAVNEMSMTSQQCHEIESDIESEIESESEEEKNTLTASKDAVCSTEVQRVIQAWNALGVSRINKIVPNTQRYNWLRKRIKDYGIDTVLEAIGKAKQSDWLMGKNKNGWTITFDWFIRPNNFPKVLDGNYDNNTRKTGRKEPVQTWVSDDLDRAERILEHQKKTVGNDPELSARAESLKERLGK